MLTDLPRPLQRLKFHQSAEAYLKSLPMEHFMEGTSQATQREITVESLAFLKEKRQDVQYFNELLVQYTYGRPPEIRKVVPDNFVALHDEPLRADGSFDLPFQPVRPFWVMEYVSKSNQRKDYDESFVKYERELKIPYYLIFYPDEQELTLFHHTGKRYRSALPNAVGRLPIPELDLEVALLRGWARFWYRGELIPLTGELVRQLGRTQEQLEHERQQKEHEQQQKERLLNQLRRLGVEPDL